MTNEFLHRLNRQILQARERVISGQMWAQPVPLELLLVPPVSALTSALAQAQALPVQAQVLA